MAVKNSFVSISQQILDLHRNTIEVLSSLNDTVNSSENQIDIEVRNSNGQTETVSLPTIGFLKSEIDRLSQNLNTLSSVDQRGAIIQPSQNVFKKIIVSDLNKEPNTISELETVTNFMSEKNWFFDGLLNPILKVRLSLGDRIEDNVRKILSRRYIVQFELDKQGVPTDVAQTAIDNFNENFINRTDITITQLESWLTNTPGIRSGKTGSKIEYDEQEFELEPNRLQFEGFFTILGSEEDTVNKRLWYQIDTLDYYEIDTGQKRQLVKNDELIINTEFSTTRYKVIDIDTNASEIRVRFERVEGLEPVPVAVVGGMKINSPVINDKNVDISIGFDEYNVVFTKAINTENALVSREWSTGVSFYTSDLTLTSTDSTGNDGKSMQQFYIDTVSDFGELLKDLVSRKIPRQKGVSPNSPVLTDTNFRVLQINKHLTDTTDDEKARRQHSQIRELRSKLDETNKTIIEKRKELFGKNFRNPKDRENVVNQISELTKQADNDSQLLNSIVNELLANEQNNNVPDKKFRVQGFWDIPEPVENGKTRQQEVVAFRIQYKYSNRDGKENENEVFKVVDENGVETNAVFSPWNEFVTRTRERSFDVNNQKFVWLDEDLSSIDAPNINSINLPLSQNEQIEIRVKAISEVGFPDSILESEWSNTITITFPDELAEGRNPREQFTKNAELEDVRNRIEADLNRKGLDEHLSSSVTFEDQFYAHLDDDIGVKQSDGRVISLKDRIVQLEAADPVEQMTDISLLDPWSNYGNGYGTARYYIHEGRVYLTGLIRVDNGDDVKNFRNRYPNKQIRIFGRNRVNTNLARIAFLPTGYRPDKRLLFDIATPSVPVNGNVIVGRVDILPNGLIIAADATSSWISLDGISFRAFN
jgi:hypothetical protein